MRILLDTHVLLWAGGQSDRLPGVARELLEDTDNALFRSVASLWEIAIRAAGAFALDAMIRQTQAVYAEALA